MSLDELWPDPDRRDDALGRVAARVHRDERDLTAAELRALTAASHGLERRESAELLGVSPQTIDSALTRARRVLQAKTTTQAVALALRRGLIR